MPGHVQVPPILVGKDYGHPSWAFHYQARYHQALLHPIQEVRRLRSKKPSRLSATWACSDSRPASEKDETSEEATQSATRRAGGPAGVIEPLARAETLIPAGDEAVAVLIQMIAGAEAVAVQIQIRAEAVAVKHTQDEPVEKVTRRAGAVVSATPAPALHMLCLARTAVCTLLPQDPHCSVRMLLPNDCCCCPMCTPRALQTAFPTQSAVLRSGPQTAGRSPPKAAAQHRQSRVRSAYAPFAFRFRSVPPVLPHAVSGVRSRCVPEG